ncbi:protein FAM162A-like [Spea bombifrons]|uniref:protein FAM162A-like n=1 Tax=Spea bombifrons TaxID=233779 RepID=UPI00234B10AF|nr:protein FAM162A-like [Spea bombifrons]
MSRLSLLRCKTLISGVYTSRSSTRKALQNRSYCQNVNDLKPKVTETFSGQHLFRHERRPTGFDKKVLVWAGRFKKEEDIPEYVSCEVVSAARNNVRIKTCIIMIVCTILGCVAMVISGKKAVREDNTLLKRNIERKAKWREETEAQE